MKRTLSALAITLFGVSALSQSTSAVKDQTASLQVQAACFVGGCSNQLCTDDPDVLSTCEWRDAYMCYASAVCERQENGKCGWTKTKELEECLEDAVEEGEDVFTIQPIEEPEPIFTILPIELPEPMLTIQPVESEVILAEQAEDETEFMFTILPVGEPVFTIQPVGESEPVFTIQPIEEPVPVFTILPVEEPEPIFTILPIELPEPVFTIQPVESEVILAEQAENESEPVFTILPVGEPEPVFTIQPVEEPEPVFTILPVEEPEPIFTILPVDSCYVTGCSSTICTSDPEQISSICDWKEEYICYQSAACERQTDGQCGWTSTPQLEQCLADPSSH